MPDVHLTIFDYGKNPVYMRLNLGTESPEAYRFMGSKGILDITEYQVLFTPQSGKDESPGGYVNSFPRAMRDVYDKQWHAEHDPVPGHEPAPEGVAFRSVSFDELRPHLWNFFQAVQSRQPVTEDAVFGHHAALACHMANESYFRKAVVHWDESSKTIRTSAEA